MNINTYPNPWDLIYFKEIAQSLNLSRAAERLGVAQPTLSVSLSRLEQQLGAELFRRKNKGLELTSGGERLLRNCNKLLSAWDSVILETKKSTTELRGHFQLGCHPSVAIYSLNPALAHFYEKYQGIEIGLVHGLSRVICEQIISDKIDFGIVVNPIQHPELQIKVLAKDEVGFWKNPKAKTTTLIYNPHLMQSQSLLKKIKKAGYHRSITSDNLEVIASLAVSGAGVALLPSRVAKLSGGGLEKVEDTPTFQDTISFVYRAGIEKTEAVKAIIGFFKELKI